MALNSLQKGLLFLKQNSIKHLKCLPYHPSSNSTVERLVQSFEKCLRTSESDGRTISHRLSSFLPIAVLLIPPQTPHLVSCFEEITQDLLTPNVENVVCLSQAK